MCPPPSKKLPRLLGAALVFHHHPEQRSGIHLSLNYHFGEHTHVRVREEAEGLQPLRCCHRHIGHTSCRIAARVGYRQGHLIAAQIREVKRSIRSRQRQGIGRRVAVGRTAVKLDWCDQNNWLSVVSNWLRILIAEPFQIPIYLPC